MRPGNRVWYGRPGAEAASLAALAAAVGAPLPRAYVEFMARSDGGEAALQVLPFYVCLDAAETVLARVQAEATGTGPVHFVVIGGNGGGKWLAFDLRESPWPLVLVDEVRPGPSAVGRVVARDFAAFAAALGSE